MSAKEEETHKVCKSPAIGKDVKDTPSGWVSACSCALISFLVVGLTRCNGLLFVDLMATSDVTRGQAAWPFNVSGAAVVFVAPLTGYLSDKVSLRSLAFVGSVLFAFGTAACYFSTNLVYLSIFFGIVRGSGMFMTATLTPIVIHRHFNRYRTTAMGLATAGGPVGSLVFPPIVYYVLDEYGLRGTFLVIGAIALHSVIGSISIRNPPTTKKKQLEAKDDQAKVSIDTPSTFEGDIKRQGSQDPVKAVDALSERTNEHEESQQDAERRECSEIAVTNTKTNERLREEVTPVPGVECHISGNTFETIKRHLFCYTGCRQFKKTLNIQASENSRESTTDGSKSPVPKPYPITSPTPLTEKLRHIFTSRGFYLIAYHQILNIYLAGTYYLVIVDYVRDKGHHNISHIYFMLTAYAIGEASGKLGLGWITDLRFVRRQSYLTVCTFAMSILICMLVWSSSFATLICFAAALGLTQGTTQAVTNVIYMEYLRKEDIPMAISCTRAVNGVASLARSLVIGFFRDTLGSYDLLFLSISGLFLFSALLWLVESFVQYIKNRHANK